MAYEIHGIDDISVGPVRRFTVHVVVRERVSSEQLVAIGREIAMQMRETHGYQGLNIGYYTFPEFIGFGWDLGNWQDAPYGDWARAMDVRPGDYSHHEGTLINFYEKSWDERPSQDTVEIWEAFQTLLYDPSEYLSDREAMQQVADQRAISIEVVEQAILEVNLWRW